MREIPTRWSLFALEYMKDHHGTNAAIRSGYSAKSAHQQASKMLADPRVRKLIDDAIKTHSAKLTVTAERVLNEIASIAFADPGSFYKTIPSGKNKGRLTLKGMDELTADQRAAVAEFDAVTKKMKLYDKLNALEKLGKHLKLFTELHETQHTFTVMGQVKRNGKKLEFNVGQPKPKR